MLHLKKIISFNIIPESIISERKTIALVSKNINKYHDAYIKKQMGKMSFVSAIFSEIDKLFPSGIPSSWIISGKNKPLSTDREQYLYDTIFFYGNWTNESETTKHLETQKKIAFLKELIGAETEIKIGIDQSDRRKKVLHDIKLVDTSKKKNLHFFDRRAQQAEITIETHSNTPLSARDSCVQQMQTLIKKISTLTKIEGLETAIIMNRANGFMPTKVKININAQQQVIESIITIAANIQEIGVIHQNAIAIIDLEKKMLGEQYADMLINNANRRLLGTAVEFSFLFLDIEGFTSISEAFRQAGQEEALFNILNKVHQYISDNISQNGGSIDNYIGDAVIAMFPAGTTKAVKASILINHGLNDVNQAIQKYFQKELNQVKKNVPNVNTILKLRIGISTGKAMVGSVGAEERWAITSIGDPVNLAARLENLNKFFGQNGIIIDEQTRNNISKNSNIVIRNMYPIKAIGQNTINNIYTVSGLKKDLSQKEYNFLVTKYNKAIELLIRHKFTESYKILKKINLKFPKDRLVKFYLNQVKAIINVNNNSNYAIKILITSNSRLQKAIKKGDKMEQLLASNNVYKAINSINNIFRNAPNNLLLGQILQTINTNEPTDNELAERLNALAYFLPKIKEVLKSENTSQTSLKTLLKSLKEKLPYANDLIIYITDVYLHNLDLAMGDFSRMFYPKTK